MANDLFQMASRIRELREISGIGVAELAAELGTTPEKYESYESEGTDIPISVLYHLSARFGVDLGELLTGSSPHLSTFSVVRKGKGMEISRYPGYEFHSLAHTFKHKMMEPLLVTLEPSDEDPALVSHVGQEFNYVLEGTIELIFDNKRVRLSAGDSVYFDPTHPHGQRAVDGRSAFLTVIAE